MMITAGGGLIALGGGQVVHCRFLGRWQLHIHGGRGVMTWFCRRQGSAAQRLSGFGLPCLACGLYSTYNGYWVHKCCQLAGAGNEIHLLVPLGA